MEMFKKFFISTLLLFSFQLIANSTTEEEFFEEVMEEEIIEEEEMEEESTILNFFDKYCFKLKCDGSYNFDDTGVNCSFQAEECKKKK